MYCLPVCGSLHAYGLTSIRFTVYPKLKAMKREVTDFKVKSVLRGTEYERESF